MGSCISKCKGKREHKEESSHIVQDKLVISQAPIYPLPLSPTKHPLSPHSTNSISSVSSFSCTASNNTGSCSLTSSSSSSSVSSSSMFLSSKEKPFSNEYLWSCVKENPQIIHVDHPTKGKNSPLQMPKKVHAQKLGLGSIEPSPSRHVVSNKRARANSPTLSRQKSFRREQEKTNSANSVPNRTLRSPSASRRFGGENYNCRGGLRNAHKENLVGSGSLYVRKENFKPSSPGNNLSRNRSSLMKRESRIYNVGSKMDEIAVGEAVSSRDDDDATPMEDIENFRPSSPGNNLSRNRSSLMKRESRIYNVGSKMDEIASGEALSNHDVDATPMEDIQNFRPSSPGNNLSRNRSSLMKRESRIYQVGSKMDETAVGKGVSSHDDDATPMEDIDNPLIALDCFIFL